MIFLYLLPIQVFLHICVEERQNESRWEFICVVYVKESCFYRFDCGVEQNFVYVVSVKDSCLYGFDCVVEQTSKFSYEC